MHESFPTEEYQRSSYVSSVPVQNSPGKIVPGQAGEQHVWPALLTLYFLSPLTAEVLTGNTPPLPFINPALLLYMTAFYGSGAILARELVRRRGLGWGHLLLLGAAYGVLEEALVNVTWFNPFWPDVLFLHGFSRWLDINWVWALTLTIYHAVMSITIPVVLVELIFPRVAARPWLRLRGLWTFSILLTLTSLLGLVLFGFVLFRDRGFTHPPLSYGLALACFVALLWFGLRRRPERTAAALPAETTPSTVRRRAPRRWFLRLAAFGGTIVFFFAGWIMHAVVSWPFIPLLVMSSVLAFTIWCIRSWSRRADWGGSHRLALASGVLGFFVLLAPLSEFVLHQIHKKNTTGLALVGLAFLIGLVWLAWRSKREVSTREDHSQP